jgi:hypothetical protein
VKPIVCFLGGFVLCGILARATWPEPLPAGSIPVAGCEASNDRALSEDGTVYGAMKCDDGIVILAPVGRVEKRHEVPSVDPFRPDV